MAKGLKVCDDCENEFYKGTTYTTWVLVVLFLFAFLPGVVYYFIKRKERCPRCDSKKWHLITRSEQALS